ncbi:MAG TPA: MFS transporter [Bryobacteraceae bacterium]|nr:MFS transporter [Bryobacteraceae bacterium]
MLRRVFTAFEYRDFRLMWAGACTSSIGTWMQKLAQSWLVLQLSGSAFMLGLDAFLGEIPIFLLALVAGVAADRFDRRRLLIYSQMLQMSCAFVLAVLFAMGVVQVWHILALSFVVGVAQAFGAPAYQSLLPSLVPREHLPNAIAMNSIQFNLARVVGPMLGGLALAKLGAAWCFGLNGLSYIAVIISLMMITTMFIPAPARESVGESMRQGLRFIGRQAGVKTLIAVSFAATSLGVSIVTFLPVFARDVYGGNEATYTLLLTVESAGAITGALLVAFRGKTDQLWRDAMISLAGLGGCMIAFALAPSMMLGLVFLFFGGLALITCFAMMSSLIQFMATDEMRGRVMSIYNIAFRGGMPIGSLITGRLVEDFAAKPVIAGEGAILVFIGLAMLVSNRRMLAE